MENIINVNALREALESGMSATTIHEWVDDSIKAMECMNKHYPTDAYVAVSRYNFKEIQEKLDNLKYRTMARFWF
jgi:hypothetical protein